MAYSKKSLEKQSIAAMEADGDILFIRDLVATLPCSRATFYNHGLDKLDTVKAALEANRSRVMQELRSKWRVSDNATLQIALYKLLAPDDEAERLNGTKQKITLDGELNHNNVRRFSEAVKKIYGCHTGDK